MLYQAKLAANIQPDSQARLVLLLLSDLGGRTWDSKEELSESLADILKSAPDILRVNMVVREGREEKVEYKIIALEYTRRVLRELVVTEKMLRRVETAVEKKLLLNFSAALFIFNIDKTVKYLHFVISLSQSLYWYYIAPTPNIF